MTAGHAQRDHAVAEALGPAPLMHNDRDWGARVRVSMRQTARYSRFVGIMKRVLPVAAAALMAAVLIYALQPRQEQSRRVAMTFERLGIVNGDLTMMKPRLTGEDGEGDPYLVTADEAIQDGKDAKRARLKNVEGDTTLQDGSWIGGMAPEGRLDARNHRLALDGAIAVYSGDGYEMHTTQADIDMQSGTIIGNRAVTGQGPLGNYRADRFEIDRRARLVSLHGHVRMIIQPARKKKHA